MTPEETSITEHLHLGSDVALRRRFMVTDEPVRANIRVGLLLEVLDKLAEETALGYVRTYYPQARVVTAAMDDLEVRAAPDVERDIVLHARINLVGTSSMEVGVRLEQASDSVAAEPIHLASCYFTMVARAIDGNVDRSLKLPPLSCQTETDLFRAQRASERRASRPRHSPPQHPTPEEYAMLFELHAKLDAGGGPFVLARDLVTSGWERTYPEHENVPQKIFGGYVVHRAYMYAHICAEMVADARALLVSTNRIDFYQPVRMGDKLHFVSRVTFTGKSSITVETAITRISRDRSVTALSNTCIFTFVNVDDRLRLMPVPEVYPTTYLEDARFLGAYRRSKLRKLRKSVRDSTIQVPKPQVCSHDEASPAEV